MKNRIVLLALLVGASGGLKGWADEKFAVPSPSKEVSAPAAQAAGAVEPCDATCGGDASVSRLRKVWEWATYRPCPARECRSGCCNNPAMPPLYTYFLDCQSGCHSGCQSGCQRSAPACESTGWRAPALWFTTWSDPGKLLRPAP